MAMNNFINCLASFASFPDDILVSSVILANNGFFYTGQNDEVECFQCHVKVKDWKEGDTPSERHHQSSPHCPFLINWLKNNGSQVAPHLPKHGLVNKNPQNNQSPNVTHKPEKSGNVQVQPKSGANNSIGVEHTNSLEQSQQSLNNSSTGQPTVQITSNTDVLQVLDKQTKGHGDCTQWFTRREITNNHSIGPGETDYTIERNRLASFVGNWPINSPVTPQELAAAGLYYVGPGDKVKCPYCKGGMYNWEEGDTGMGEHAKHFPQCSFVKQKISQSLTYNPNPGGQSEERQPLSKGISNQPQNNSTNDKWRNNPAVNIALDMGYDMKLVEQAVKHIKKSGNPLNTDTLVDVLFDLENQKQSSTETGATGLNPPPESPIETEDVTNRTNPQNTSKTNNFGRTTSSELSELIDENLKLKESTTCKICLENDVNTLFLPCRHLVCCEECSEAVRHCPVCRTLIVGTVKTFLS